MTFVDTSALLAFLDRDAARHEHVVASMAILADGSGVTHNYVAVHAAAATSHVKALRRRSSLVDHVSFEVMRRRDLQVALALDAGFASAGFRVVP